MREFHPGTFAAGAVFTAIGVAFLLEALGVWVLRFRHLEILLPVALIIIGVAVVIATLWARPGPGRPDRQARPR